MKTLLYLTIMLAYFSATGQQRINSVYFENDEFELDAADKVVISEFASFILSQKESVTAIQIIAYTDTFATLNYNVILSEKRAMSVKQELATLLPLDLISKLNIKWHGELLPAQIPQGFHYTERCADMVLNYTVKREEIPEVEPIAELFNLMRKPVQDFAINSARDTILLGDEGTIININANSFYIPENLKGEKVEIILIEYYDYASMILNGLTTTSGEQQLETGGMIYLNAKIGNRMLTVREENPITMMFPAKNLQEDMVLFTGQHDDKGKMDWQLTRNRMQRFSAQQVNFIMYPSNFKKKKYRKDCPYLFCGIRQDLNINDTKYKEKRAYYLINWKAYHKYTDSMCVAFGVTDYNKLARILQAKARKQEQANYYVANSTGLGFMNCDRFINSPIEDRVVVSVDEEPSENITAFLVFNSIKSILPINYNKPSAYIFENVGKGFDCSVVVIKYDNKIPYLSVTPIVTADNITIKPDYVQLSSKELKVELGKLN